MARLQPEIEYSSEEYEGIHFVALEGDLETYNMSLFNEVLQTKLGDAACTALVIDLSRAPYIDSTGLSAFVNAHTAAKERGIPFVVDTIDNRRMHKLFTITGLDNLFQVIDERPSVD